MRLTLDASDNVSKRYLSIDSQGGSFCDSNVSNEVRKFAFRHVQSVLLSPQGMLSVQAGTQVFKIQTRHDDEMHRCVIAALIGALRKTLDQDTPVKSP